VEVWETESNREESPDFGLLWQALSSVHKAVALNWSLQYSNSRACNKNVFPQSLSALLKLPAVVEGKLGKTDAKGCTYS